MHPKTSETQSVKGRQFLAHPVMYSECVHGQQGTDGWRRRVALSER